MKKVKVGTRFLKIFLSYILVIFIPLSIISSIIFSTNIGRLRRDFEDKALRDLDNFSTTVEGLLVNIENASMQLSLTPTINKVLKYPFSAGMYDYVSLREELQDFCALNTFFHSVNLYIKLNNKVVTSGEGIYELDEFYDKSLIAKAGESGRHRIWYSSRKLVRTGGSTAADDVVTLATKVPVTETIPLGMLLVNIQTENLLKTIEQINYSLKSRFLIIDAEGNQVIGSSTGEYDKTLQNKELLQFMDSDQGMFAHDINGISYTVVYWRQSYSNWIYLSLIAGDDLLEQIQNEKNQMVQLFVLSLIFGILISYAISQMMYNPWKRLMTKIGEYLRRYENDSRGNVNDEYNAVDKAIDYLIDDNQHIQAIIEESKPILKEKLVSDILWNNIESPEDVSSKLEYLGIQFKYPDFIPLVVMVNALEEAEENNQTEKMRIYVREVIERDFSRTSVIVSTLIDEDKSGFIINFEAGDHLEENMTEICRNIIAAVHKQMKVFLCFSFGRVCSSLSDMEYSFLNARRRLNFKPVINDGDILFDDREESQFQYPLFIQKKIINGIMTGNQKALDEGIDELFEQYINKPGYSKNEIQQMVILIVSMVVNKLWKDGEERQVFKANIHDIFNEIQKCKSSVMLKEVIQDYFYGLIDSRPGQESSGENSYIALAVEYMEENYAQNISVVNIAEWAGLNPSYLNRIFKRNTGKTLIEYLTALRIEKAKELFKNHNLSLNNISLAVGYNSLHNFIRVFKKYEGVTPGEYRETYKND